MRAMCEIASEYKVKKSMTTPAVTVREGTPPRIITARDIYLYHTLRD